MGFTERSRATTSASLEDGPLSRSLAYRGVYFLCLGFVYVISATVDIPTALRWGPVSASAAITVFVALVAWLMWLASPLVTRSMLMTLMPLLMFSSWSLFSNLWGAVSTKGLQNQTVWHGFMGLVVLSAYVGYRSPAVYRVHKRSIQVASVIGFGLFFVTLLKQRTGWQIPVGVGFRQFALFALIPLAWRLGSGASRPNKVVLGIIATIILSLSRMALLAALGLSVFSMAIARRRHSMARLIVVSILGVSVSVILFTQYRPLASRDVSSGAYADLYFHIGDVRIYGSGRVRMWRVTMESIGRSPWVGQGAGSASAVILSDTGWLEHPHNDYLRVWHDYGIVGLCLLLAGIISLLWRLWRLWRGTQLRTTPRSRQVCGAAFLLVAGLSLAMITDNVIVYHFLMYPLGLLVGTSLGIASRAKATIVAMSAHHSRALVCSVDSSAQLAQGSASNTGDSRLEGTADPQ